jgi:hypothetical protein
VLAPTRVLRNDAHYLVMSVQLARFPWSPVYRCSAGHTDGILAPRMSSWAVAGLVGELRRKLDALIPNGVKIVDDNTAGNFYSCHQINKQTYSPVTHTVKISLHCMVDCVSHVWLCGWILVFFQPVISSLCVLFPGA